MSFNLLTVNINNIQHYFLFFSYYYIYSVQYYNTILDRLVVGLALDFWCLNHEQLLCLNKIPLIGFIPSQLCVIEE